MAARGACNAAMGERPGALIAKHLVSLLSYRPIFHFFLSDRLCSSVPSVDECKMNAVVYNLVKCYNSRGKKDDGFHVFQEDFGMIIQRNEMHEAFVEKVICNDDSWILALLTDSDNYRICSGKGESGIYTIQVSRKNCDWKMAIGDVMSYSREMQGNLLLMISEEELAQVKEYYHDHSCMENKLRMDEPKVLIHSTSLEVWEKIVSDGCLKSWNKAYSKNGNAIDAPIGQLLGDPESFRDYIMFGSGVACELVVASKQKGRIVMDPDETYQSGVRLYFDAQKIAQDGLLIRDGVHLKVRDQLPLNPYLLWAATWKNIGLFTRATTPNQFAETADRVFHDRR